MSEHPSNRPVRVAHIITRLCQGGAQENTFHTIRLANRERFQCDLISGPTTGREGSIETAITEAGIPIQRVPTLIRTPSPIHDALALRHLTRLLAEGRYDIVHTHMSKAGFLGRLAAERVGIPHVIHTPHGNVFHGYFNGPLTRLFVWMERHAARRTDRIIELTQGGIAEHLAEGIGQREQYRVVFSGIDTHPYEEAVHNREQTREALGIRPEEIVVGGVGRLEPVKGFTYFVAMAEALKAVGQALRFMLVGDGGLRAELEQQAETAGVSIEFLGLREDIPTIMAAFDILVVPSINEGMGRVILEAGAAGVPVVASRVGGIPDIVDDGETGLLTPPRAPEALAEALQLLIQSPERRRLMGATARAKIVPHYSLEQMVQRIETVYEELLHANS